MNDCASRDAPPSAGANREGSFHSSGQKPRAGLRKRARLRPRLKSTCATLSLALLAGGHLLAQSTPAAVPPAKAPWEISLTVDGYLPQDQDGYVDPIVAADHGWLHLEARYNYENLRTGSLWAGYNFTAGKRWVFKITPMIGGLLGRSTGIAPGFETSLNYKRVTLSLTNEYVFDTNKKAGNFYYGEPELVYGLTDWLRVGLAAQHTKAFEKKLDIQRAFLVGLAHKRAEFTVYVYDLGVTAPTLVLELGWSF
jgi:hypothetical protein